MKMTTQNLFPPAEASLQFREQLKLEVLEVYNRQRQPRFNWRWLFTPGVALASLLFIVLVGKQLSLPYLPDPMDSNQTSEISKQSQQTTEEGNNTEQTQLVEKPQNLDQLDRELTDLSDALNSDNDLVAAINFSSL